MINDNIRKEHVLKSIKEIDKDGVPNNRKSTKYQLSFKDKNYPPKYVLSLANRYANGNYLNPSEFGGGREANNFLKNLGFTITEK